MMKDALHVANLMSLLIQRCIGNAYIAPMNFVEDAFKAMKGTIILPTMLAVIETGLSFLGFY